MCLTSAQRKGGMGGMGGMGGGGRKNISLYIFLFSIREQKDVDGVHNYKRWLRRP